MTWDAAVPPARGPIGPAGWARVLRRGLPVALVTFGGLGLLLALRLVERPLFGAARPWTPAITQAVCRFDLWAMGIGRTVRGTAMQGGGAVVANHASWLDIFALNAGQRVYFVAKSEVRGWAGIGWLARATGTLFIRRDRREAAAQRALFRDRLAAGHLLLFFPEGTSTDGLRVLPFKTTLFDAFMSDSGAGTRETGTAGDGPRLIQPVSVAWHAPPGAPGTFYGWWGAMDFAAHLLTVLAAPRQGRVEIVYHPPLRVADHPDRKALARALETAVRDGQPLAGGRAA